MDKMYRTKHHKSQLFKGFMGDLFVTLLLSKPLADENHHSHHTLSFRSSDHAEQENPSSLCFGMSLAFV